MRFTDGCPSMISSEKKRLLIEGSTRTGYSYAKELEKGRVRGAFRSRCRWMGIAPLCRAAAKIFLITTTSLSIGCHEAAPKMPGPLIQRGYLWQRVWNPAVADAFREAESRLDGVVTLGAEIVWTGKTPQTVRATINWEMLKSAKKGIGLALRVAPFTAPLERMICRRGRSPKQRRPCSMRQRLTGYK